jgi:hypothetical protein
MPTPSDAPVDRLLPELANRGVLRRIDAALDDTVPARRPITVEELLTFRCGHRLILAPPGRLREHVRPRSGTHSGQFGEVLQAVRIPTELAGKLATVLRESQTDKEIFVRTSTLRLQQQMQLALEARSDARGAPVRRDSRRTLDLEVDGAAGGTQAGPRGDGASRKGERRLRGCRPADSARSGDSRENGRIEFNVRSRKSFALLDPALRCVREWRQKREIGSSGWIRSEPRGRRSRPERY